MFHSSFGITLYEIMTRGEDPYPGKSESEVVDLAKEGNLMSRPPNVDKDVWEVMLNCWRMKPDGTCVCPLSVPVSVRVVYLVGFAVSFTPLTRDRASAL